MTDRRDETLQHQAVHRPQLQAWTAGRRSGCMSPVAPNGSPARRPAPCAEDTGARPRCGRDRTVSGDIEPPSPSGPPMPSVRIAATGTSPDCENSPPPSEPAHPTRWTKIVSESWPGHGNVSRAAATPLRASPREAVAGGLRDQAEMKNTSRVSHLREPKLPLRHHPGGRSLDAAIQCREA